MRRSGLLGGLGKTGEEVWTPWRSGEDWCGGLASLEVYRGLVRRGAGRSEHRSGERESGNGLCLISPLECRNIMSDLPGRQRGGSRVKYVWQLSPNPVKLYLAELS